MLTLSHSRDDCCLFKTRHIFSVFLSVCRQRIHSMIADGWPKGTTLLTHSLEIHSMCYCEYVTKQTMRDNRKLVIPLVIRELISDMVSTLRVAIFTSNISTSFFIELNHRYQSKKVPYIQALTSHDKQPKYSFTT